jgi:protein-S-isoprenylcysteine O-methyltransferase Ste14
MEPLSIGILIVALALVIEVVVMLLLLKVDKKLLILPIIGIILVIISFVFYGFQDEIFSSLPESASLAVIYILLTAGLVCGLLSAFIWFKGEEEARRIASIEKSLDHKVSALERDVRGGGDELSRFDDDMSGIKTKVDEYESREKEV